MWGEVPPHHTGQPWNICIYAYCGDVSPLGCMLTTWKEIPSSDDDAPCKVRIWAIFMNSHGMAWIQVPSCIKYKKIIRRFHSQIAK